MRRIHAAPSERSRLVHSSMRSQNWRMVFHLLDAWFSRPAAAYTG